MSFCRTPTTAPTTSPTEVCQGLEVSGGINAMNGIYHKLPTNLNGHFQWSSRFSHDLDAYTIYFDTKTYNEWTISGNGGTMVLQGLESFFEPLTDLSTAKTGSQTYQVKITCHDVS